MSRSIELALRAQGYTAPNPCVGCVIVNQTGHIVGEGYHRKAGGHHAEVEALLMAGDKAENCTAYISLEPCNHYGRTPPCTEALISHKLSRVVAAIVDPDSRVSGNGLKKLREHGMNVTVGVCEELARQVNEPFIYRVLTRRPYTVCWLQPAYDSSSLPVLPTLAKHIAPAVPDLDSVLLSAWELRAADWRGLSALPAHLRLVLLQQSDLLATAVDVTELYSEDYYFQIDDVTATSCESFGALLAGTGVPEKLVTSVLRDQLARQRRITLVRKVLPGDGAEKSHAPVTKALPSAMTLLAERGCNALLIRCSLHQGCELSAAGLVQRVVTASTSEVNRGSDSMKVARLYERAHDALAPSHRLSTELETTGALLPEPHALHQSNLSLTKEKAGSLVRTHTHRLWRYRA